MISFFLVFFLEYTPQQDLELKQRIAQTRKGSNATLARKQLTDKHMKIVAEELISTKQCRELELNTNQITADGASILAGALCNNTTLISLKLYDNKIGDKGVIAFTEVLKSKNAVLEIFDIGLNETTNDIALHIAEMLKTNKNLTQLLLSESNIRDDGVKQLASVLETTNTTLKYLKLSDNKSVTDSSVDSLITMIKQNRSLEMLDLRYCDLSEVSKENLHAAIKSRKRMTVWV